MSAVRPTQPPRDLTSDEKAMKVMTAQLVEEAGGNGTVAQLLGVSKSLVSKWCHPRIPDGEQSPSFMPMQHVMTLQRRANTAVFSRWMTEVAETDPTTQFEPYSEQHLARIAAVTAEAQLTHLRALADGSLDAADRDELRGAFAQGIAVFTRLLRKVDQP